MNFDAFVKDIKDNSWNVFGVEVYKKGQLIHSFGDTRDNTHNIYSAAKTVLSVAVGIASDENRFDINRPVLSYLPSDKTNGMSDEQKDAFGRITIQRLLTMSVGDFPFRPEGDSWLDFALSIKLTDPDGRTFNYSNIPLGISQYEYSRCPEGYFYGASGMRMTVNGLSRIGLLLYNKGMADVQRILSEEYVAATSIQQMNREGGYGYFIWKYRDGFSINGKLKQKCYVLPGQDLVITYLSHIEDDSHDLLESMEKNLLDIHG